MPSWRKEYETYELDPIVHSIDTGLADLKGTQPDSVADRLNRIDDVLQKLKTRLGSADLHATSTLVLQELKSSVSALQNQVINLLNRSDQLNDSLIDDVIAQILRNIPLIQTHSDSTLSAQTEALVGKVTNKANALSESLDIIFNSAEAHLKKIRDLEIEGKKLTHLAAGTIKSNEYLQRAAAEKTEAETWTTKTWTFAGLSLGTLAIGIIVQIILAQSSAGASTASLITLGVSKIALAVTFGIVARWCSKRAGRHLVDEARYRRLGINTATIDAFISELDAPSKIEIMKAVAIHIFTDDGHQDLDTGFEGGPVSLNEIVAAASKRIGP